MAKRRRTRDGQVHPAVQRAAQTVALHRSRRGLVLDAPRHGNDHHPPGRQLVHGHLLEKRLELMRPSSSWMRYALKVLMVIVRGLGPAANVARGRVCQGAAVDGQSWLVAGTYRGTTSAGWHRSTRNAAAASAGAVEPDLKALDVQLHVIVEQPMALGESRRDIRARRATRTAAGTSPPSSQPCDPAPLRTAAPARRTPPRAP